MRISVLTTGLVICTAAVLSAALGCDDSGGGSDDTHGDAGTQHQASEHICQGDRWGNSDELVAAIADCTTITGNLSITGNQLVEVELPKLTRVGGLFTVWSNPLLTSIAAPKLTSVGGFVEVSYNEKLTALQCPALESVNETHAVDSNFDLSINDNPLLPTCQANAIRDRLLAHAFDGKVVITGNHGTCPP